MDAADNVIAEAEAAIRFWEAQKPPLCVRVLNEDEESKPGGPGGPFMVIALPPTDPPCTSLQGLQVDTQTSTSTTPLQQAASQDEGAILRSRSIAEYAAEAEADARAAMAWAEVAALAAANGNQQVLAPAPHQQHLSLTNSTSQRAEVGYEAGSDADSSSDGGNGTCQWVSEYTAG
mmetsp:Transcript_11261/g.19732  ORF Transcript_11261/g.19732 Transcript_11261/m.19732 type:complete len:176 (+) Transcript_11261:189-716(+)